LLEVDDEPILDKVDRGRRGVEISVGLCGVSFSGLSVTIVPSTSVSSSKFCPEKN
jgi:hypothetical protein